MRFYIFLSFTLILSFIVSMLLIFSSGISYYGSNCSSGHDYYLIKNISNFIAGIFLIGVVFGLFIPIILERD